MQTFFNLKSVVFLQYISQCIVGASVEEMGEEEDEAASIHTTESRKEGSYRVVGTLKDPNAKPPSFVTEVITVS